MSVPIRPRRSVLYMPGANARALDKARGLPADGLIFDLEDAVAPDSKGAARDMVARALADGGYGGRELVLRVNGLATAWGFADLAAAAAMPLDAVLLPKVESADAVRQAVSVIEASGRPELAIWCMLETPLGILSVREIAAAHPNVGVLVMGTSDLTKELQALHMADRLPMMTALGLAMLAARAYGLGILDGVHLDLADDAGFEAACRQGRALGFDGKTLIHPKTIDAANAAFGPSPEEVTWSRRIIAAHAEAERAGRGIVLVDGKLIENLHVADARRRVALAEQIDALAAAISASRGPAR